MLQWIILLQEEFFATFKAVEKNSIATTYFIVISVNATLNWLQMTLLPQDILTCK
jgi:hypothetical protein